LGSSAAEARTHGNLLVEGDAHAQRAAGGFLQGACRAQGEIVVGREAFGVMRAADVAGRIQLQGDVVFQGDEPEDGFQQVQAVGAAAGDVQGEVEVGNIADGHRSGEGT